MGSHSVEPESAPLTRRRLREAERTTDPTASDAPASSAPRADPSSPVSVRSGSTPVVATPSAARGVSAGPTPGSTTAPAARPAQTQQAQISRYVSRPGAEPDVATPVRPMVAQQPARSASAVAPEPATVSASTGPPIAARSATGSPVVAATPAAPTGRRAAPCLGAGRDELDGHPGSRATRPPAIAVRRLRPGVAGPRQPGRDRAAASGVRRRRRRSRSPSRGRRASCSARRLVRPRSGPRRSRRRVCRSRSP